MNTLKRLLLGLVPLRVLRRVLHRHRGHLKQIIVVRTDLNMRRGKEAAQTAHASMGCYLTHRKDPWMRLWLDGAFAKIVVGIDGEAALLDLRNQARDAGVSFCLIQDAGRTEFSNVPTYTALSIGPGEPETITRLTGHLKLR